MSSQTKKGDSMGYSYSNTQARIIDGGKVYKPHDVDELYVDPCAKPQYRYTLRYFRYDARVENATPCRTWFQVNYAWWEVIEPWDDARTRYIKWTHNKNICRQADIVQAEQRKLKALTG